MDKYEEKAYQIRRALGSRFRSDETMIIKALREAAAEAYEDAATGVESEPVATLGGSQIRERLTAWLRGMASALRSQAREK